MAIAYASVTIHSRAKGHSAVAASAYRTRSRQYDERIDKTFDFSEKTDLVFTEMLLPDGASEKFQDNEYLWNAVESCERRGDSQLCKDIVLALPNEIEGVKQIEIAKRFAQVHFVENGLPAEVSIHDHGDGNPHAHILIPTRRLEGDKFSRLKARDLNPKFAKGFIVEKDYWGEQWRDFQENFFKEHDIDLSVDLNHVIPERHEGSVRKGGHYIREENCQIKQAREEIVLESVENIINLLSIETSVFTKEDVEKLLFKSIKSPRAAENFAFNVQEVLGNKNVIELGVNDKGRVCYTTRHQYVQEAKLLSEVGKLQRRKGHVFNTPLDVLHAKYNLNDEQKAAFSYVVKGSDISCIIGRPGTGKSYLLKPLFSHFDSHSCRVLGAALSGKVAKELQQETGIKTSTIASLNAQILKGKLELTRTDVIVVDEANMVDFASMSFLINQAKKARAKIILMGDTMQLKAIKKGEIFRGILDKVGYISLDDIKRQRNLLDRQASIDYSKGDIDRALSHYHEKGQIEFGKQEDIVANLVTDWVASKSNADEIKSHVMLSFTRKSVGDLNLSARAALKEKSLLGDEEVLVNRDAKAEDTKLKVNDKVMITVTDKKYGLHGGAMANVEQLCDDKVILIDDSGKQMHVPIHLKHYLQRAELESIPVSKGERLLFTKNSKDIGVKNGDLATVISVNESSIKARLDNGKDVSFPTTHRYLDYGYALTVHKSEGMTYDKTSLLIENNYWNKSLGFVGMTRHRDNLQVYVNNQHNEDIAALKNTLSKDPIKDNVIDWPLTLATRLGFSPDAMIGRAVNKIAGASNKIKDKFTYVANYELFLRKQKAKELLINRQDRREVAKRAAEYLDSQHAASKLYRSVEERAKLLKKSMTDMSEYDKLYKLSQARDKKAHALVKSDGAKLPSLSIPSLKPELVERAANRYEKYLIIKEVAHQKEFKPEQDLKLAKRVHEQIELGSKNTFIGKHITRESQSSGLTYEQISDRLDKYQRTYKKDLLKTLKEKNPVLNEYVKKATERYKLTGLRAELLDKDLSKLAKQIAANKPLATTIKANFVNLTNSLKQSLDIGKDKGRSR